jgi:two-component system chemotaxis response regulator CheY
MQDTLKLMKVLIADDSAIMRDLIKGLLREHGVKAIEFASKGDEALKKIIDACANDQPYHIAFLDWHMPNMHGIDVLGKIRNDSQFDDMAMVMVTAEKDKDKVISAINMGATNSLVKPITADCMNKNLINLMSWFEKRNIIH